MRKFVTFGVLGAAMLAVPSSAHATAPAQAHAPADPTGAILAPAWNLTGTAESTVCQQELGGVPVVSQYAGVVSSVCKSRGDVVGIAQS
ncbi:hypothetical protein [Streptomyces sp. NPDC046261]|uniref:hypothetical protein n=1 Tax=Streptomyces sp. NPDC046261 TaxID=3157200 RepID=UPI00340305E8